MGFGDVSGSKQSTAKTYLDDAHVPAPTSSPTAEPSAILVENGRAAGVEATWTEPKATDGATAEWSSAHPTVVVACGSIESPALLLRSGIGGPAAGRVPAPAPDHGDQRLLRRARTGAGARRRRRSHTSSPNLEDGYGFLLECSQSTTGLFGAATPWTSGREHKRRMLDWTQDRGLHQPHPRPRPRAGRRSTTTAAPVAHYRLDDELDQHNFRRGLAEMIKLHDAAGAERIIALARGRRTGSAARTSTSFIAEISSGSLEPRDHAIFSAHQMGSCRMGTDPATSVADPWGELHDTKGVWIGDASAFPTRLGHEPDDHDHGAGPPYRRGDRGALSDRRPRCRG